MSAVFKRLSQHKCLASTVYLYTITSLSRHSSIEIAAAGARYIRQLVTGIALGVYEFMIARVHDKSGNGNAKQHIENAVKRQLRSSAYYSLRRVSCRMDGNVLRLGGRVPSYYEKQLAQSLALTELSADMVLENGVEVSAAGPVPG